MCSIIKVKIKEKYVTLGQLLKIVDLVSSGGETKIFLINNIIKVNGQDENRRGKKLYIGDQIEISHKVYEIC